MINANKEKLGAFFSGEVRYIVPFYQRSYVWEEDNWETLWDGLSNVFQAIRQDPHNRVEHFIGTLITKQRYAEQIGENRYDVIDGQQRLTTIALLIKAMSNVCEGSSLPMLRKILDDYLCFSDSRGKIHTRIVHSRVDSEYFNAIIMGTDIRELRDPEHKMMRAFDFFRAKLIGWTDVDIDTLKNIIMNNVPVVSMLLSRDDDEQVIFDTINSLGVKLTTAELLKNFIFKEVELQDLYDAYWVPTFEADEEQIQFWSKDKTSGRIIRSNIEVLLYCYLVSQKISEVKLETLFKEYKNWLAGKDVVEKRHFLEELRGFADLYFEFPSDEALNEIAFTDHEKRFFHVIENLEITTIYPLVLFIYGSIEDGLDRIKMLRILESYLIRRTVCRLTTKNYNNIFIEIIRALTQTALEHLRAATAEDLLELLVGYNEETNIFPSDAAFESGLFKSILTNKYAKEILYCVALKQKDTPHADVNNLSAQSLSVEHMMPKQWKENWMVDGMTDEKAVERDRKLRTLGNLTLVTRRLNSKMQNAAWPDKTIQLRKNSSLEITINYLGTSTWDESAIASRANDLYEIAREIWRHPSIRDGETEPTLPGSKNLTDNWGSSEKQVRSRGPINVWNSDVIELSIKPSDIEYGILQFSRSQRPFFPGLGTTFVLDGDYGTFKNVHVSSGKKDSRIGDTEEGKYLTGRLQRLYKHPLGLKEGDDIIVEMLEHHRRYVLRRKT